MSKSKEPMKQSIKDVKISHLKKAYLIGASISVLAFTTVLGFQVYHSLEMTDIMPVLGIGSSILIVLIAVMLPHAMPGISLMGPVFKWLSGIGSLFVTILALVASYVNLSGVFREAGESWAGIYLLPLSFDLAAIIGLGLAFGAATQIVKLQSDLVDVDTEPVVKQSIDLRPQKPSEEKQSGITVREVKEDSKKEQEPSQKPLKADAQTKTLTSSKPKALPEATYSLSDNELRWMEKVQEVYEPGMSLSQIREKMKARGLGSGNQNTLSKIRKILASNEGE